MNLTDRAIAGIVKSVCLLLLTLSVLNGCNSEDKEANPPLKALITDGQNSHGCWPKTTAMMKSYLEETGLFSVDIARTNPVYLGPHSQFTAEELPGLLARYPANDGREHVMKPEPAPDPAFSPDFSAYDVVISNFGWRAAPWPQETREAFETYMREGGGLVIVHAASNPFGDWEEFNRMTGLGGWGGRDSTAGPYVYFDGDDQLVTDRSSNICGSHGAQLEFVIDARVPDHPVTKGLPASWVHARDELYERLCGPAENMTVLATAYSSNAEDEDRTGRHEPMLMVVDYGQGRVFHTTLGHTDYSMECVGFIATLQRGAEWAATGEVTQEVPADFPDHTKVTSRAWRH